MWIKSLQKRLQYLFLIQTILWKVFLLLENGFQLVIVQLVLTKLKCLCIFLNFFDLERLSFLRTAFYISARMPLCYKQLKMKHCAIVITPPLFEQIPQYERCISNALQFSSTRHATAISYSGGQKFKSAHNYLPLILTRALRAKWSILWCSA